MSQPTRNYIGLDFETEANLRRAAEVEATYLREYKPVPHPHRDLLDRFAREADLFGSGAMPGATITQRLEHFAALVAEECALQSERSTCADQAAARIRALFPPPI